MMLAFGPLHLTPETFWGMSPCELQAALDGHSGAGMAIAGAEILRRHEFEALYAQYPDQGEDHGANG